MSKEIKILIVDDADINRQILRTLFDKEYEIYEADDGLSALKVMEEVPIDIIILDIIMPKMGGIEFLQIIKDDERYKHIPVIVSSAAGTAENELQVLQLGADNFITKPYNPKIIVHRVHSIVSTYIEARKELLKETEEVNEKMFSILEMIPGGFCVVQKSDCYRLVFANSKLAAMLGYAGRSSELIEGRDVLEFVEEKEHEKALNLLSEAEDSVNVEAEIKVQKSDASTSRMLVQIRTNVLPSGIMQYLIVMTPFDPDEKEEELTKELRKYEQRVRHDNLTDIYNKETFLEATALMFKRNPDQKFVMAQWNLDRFKAVNDLYGSSVGDRIIHDFGEYLKKFCTGTSTYGRMEADNFVTCHTEEFIAEHMPEIESLLLGKIKWYNVNYPIQMHVGFYNIESLTDDVVLMCDRASMALTPIKNSYVRRSAYFSAHLRDLYVKEQQMMRDAERAIVNHEFFVVYQPIIDVKTRKIVSAEALVRWKKEDGEIISPGEFIPIFEKNGFISKLDMYVCEEVCKFQSNRMASNKNYVPISVNLSRIDFYNQDLNDDIRLMLEKYNLSSECLKLEITESAYMDRPQEIMDAVIKFQNSGFKILMDDFGSGYSSLNMLKDVSADVLKIDMRFMDDLENSDKAGSILYSIIQMAKSINMEVVAEGVETVSQYEMLHSMDCDSVQGYFFFMPLSEEEFALRLDKEIVDELVTTVGLRHCIVYYTMNSDQGNDFKLHYEDICDVNVIIDDEDLLIDTLQKDCMSIDLTIIDMSGHVDDCIKLVKRVRTKSFLDDMAIIILADETDRSKVDQLFALNIFDVVIKPIDDYLMEQRLRKQLRVINAGAVKDEYVSADRRKHLSKRLNHSAEISSASLAKFVLKNEEDFPLSDIIFINDKFLYYHQLMEEEAYSKKNLAQILGRVMPIGRDRFMQGFKVAVDEKRDSFQKDYFIHWENGFTRRMLVNCTLQYSSNEVYLDFLEIENQMSAEFKVDRLIQNLFREITMSADIKLWVFRPDADKLEYHQTGEDGKYITRVFENGMQFIIDYPEFRPEDEDRVRELMARVMQGDEIINEDFLMRSGFDEEDKWIRISCVKTDALPDDGDIYLGITRNISNDKIAENQRWNERQYWERMSRNSDLFVEADLTGNRIISENTFEILNKSGIHRKISFDTLVKYLLSVVSDDERDRVAQIINRKNLIVSYELGEKNIKHDVLADLLNEGRYLWYNSDIFLFRNETNNHVYVSWQITNISKGVVRENLVKQAAQRDPLTGLCNRVMLEQNMDIMLSGTNHCVNSVFMMIDLDNYKSVNDSFGHDFGDDVLRAVGNVIAQGFSEDNIVARLNGDEFAVFMPETKGCEEALSKATEICDSARLRLEKEDGILMIGCSIGVVFTDNVSSFKEAYPMAEKALREAKEAGKDCYRVYES